jgi:hypothetical protein
MAENKFDLQANIRVRDLLRSMMEHGGWQILETWLRAQIMLSIDTGLDADASPTKMAHTAGKIKAYQDLPKWVKQQHDALDMQIKKYIAQQGGNENVAQ